MPRTCASNSADSSSAAEVYTRYCAMALGGLAERYATTTKGWEWTPTTTRNLGRWTPETYAGTTPIAAPPWTMEFSPVTYVGTTYTGVQYSGASYSVLVCFRLYTASSAFLSILMISQLASRRARVLSNPVPLASSPRRPSALSPAPSISPYAPRPSLPST